MDKKTVFIKTEKGESEGTNLSSDLKRILSLIDSKSAVDELVKRAPPSLRDGCKGILGELADGGYIRDKNHPQIQPKIAVPKFNPLKMFNPKQTEELDFSNPGSAPIPNVAALAAKQKADEAAQLEAAVAAAKARTNAEAVAKAEAKARQDAEVLTRGRALAEADAAAKAEAKAKKEAEIAERAKVATEANARREAELRAKAGAKAKQEAIARMKADQEAARNRAALEAAARVRAEIEAAARAQQIAEAKVKQEAAARIEAQQETARAKAALEVAARAKIEAEAKSKRDAEAARLKIEEEAARVKAELEAAAKAKLEAEAALLRAEQEADRIRAEMAATQARADAEAKARAEVRARQEAEENARREAEVARLKAEHEAALVRAEQQAIAKVREEAAARVRQEAEEQARRDAETARIRAEYEAALVRAEQEAVARVRAEAAAQTQSDAEVRAIAEALERQLQEETIAKLEAEAIAKRAAAIAEKEALERAASSVAPAYEIQLDDFLASEQFSSQKAASVQPQAVHAKLAADEMAADVTKADLDNKSLTDVAAEMARLKDESEAARRRLEEEARRKEEELALAEEQARAWAEAEERAKQQALGEVELRAQQSVLTQAKSKQGSATRSRRKPLPLGKITLSLIVLALIVVAVLPYVYPLDEYIVPLEQQLTAQMKQPVHIGSLSASSLPPKLQLKNVTLGSSKEVNVGNIVLSFDVFSLFSDIRVISNAELQDISIQGNQLEKQAASLKLAGGNARYPVRSFTVQRLKIVTDEVALPILNGVAETDAQGGLSRVALHSADDKLGIDLQADQGRWQVGMNLRESNLFFLPDLVFSDLSAKGILSEGEINFTDFDAHMYNGILLGSAKISWRSGWQLQGRFEAKTFDMDKMFQKYHVEGELYGEGSFSFVGSKLSQLDDSPHLEGSFSVKKGLINGFDMVETARLLSREHMVGGRTRFDDMIGLIQLDNHVAHFRQVKIVSSTLSASGMFDVSSTNQLGGSFSAEIKMRSGNNALILFGTLAEPKLRSGY
jgi:hypothetical protein